MFNIKDYLKKINCPCYPKDSFKFLKFSYISFLYNMRQTIFILEERE